MLSTQLYFGIYGPGMTEGVMQNELSIIFSSFKQTKKKQNNCFQGTLLRGITNPIDVYNKNVPQERHNI
jgi:hypothetical protein